MATNLTWYSDVNYPFPDNTSADGINRSWMWCLKSLLQQQIVGASNGPNGTAPSSSAWTCEGSSDSLTASMDGIDRWGSGSYDASKLVYNNDGNAHSWIVLKSPSSISVSGSYYLLINLGYNDTTTYATAKMSKIPFAGGSTTQPPSSSATAVVIADQYYDDTTTSTSHFAHMVRTANGAFYFTPNCQGRTSFGNMLGMVPLLNQETNDQWNIFSILSYYYGLGTGQFDKIGARTYNNLSEGNNSASRIYIGNWSNDQPGLNSASNTFNTFPVLCYTSNADASGIRGTFPDIYLLGQGRTVGDVVPATGAQEYIATPYILLPYNCLLTV